ncbi:MAG TPA: hypothetical protein DDY29_15445 [Rhodobacteraceae bacterium]|jgi:membrane protein implicated in regulation of membrane protease activity|nr:hypothetical protein [Paracoccaceae bacterium]HBH00047.1 hypothetical protein [Paracoccaceae bacterium]
MWMVAGLGLGILEVVVPGYIFLGFAIGALATGALIGIGGGALGLSMSWTLLIFALLSLGAWLALRSALGIRRGQVKTWHRDINEE